MTLASARPKLADFCSGAGLMSEGFRRAGFDPAFAMEADPLAAESYYRNVGSHVQMGDVTDCVPEIDADVLVAGPPCQGFSTLGKRDNRDPRNDIALAIAQWTAAIGPRAVVVENVPRFAASQQYALLKARMGILGYEGVEWKLNAAQFGVAQTRIRVFCVFAIGRTPVPPVPDGRLISVAEVFDGVRRVSKDDKMNFAPTPGALALERFRRIPPGGDKRDLIRAAPRLCPPSWVGLGTQATDVWGRMHADRPSNTLRCCFQNPSKGRYIHPFENRVITLREGARLQGIPDSWEFAGRPYPVARQIGNGVPVPLAESVGRAVLAALS